MVVNFAVLAGDANGDGVVNISDFAVLRANFGVGSVFSRGDFNYDGTVNISDFAILRGNFGSDPGEPIRVLCSLEDEA